MKVVALWAVTAVQPASLPVPEVLGADAERVDSVFLKAALAHSVVQRPREFWSGFRRVGAGSRKSWELRGARQITQSDHSAPPFLAGKFSSVPCLPH